MTKEVQFLTALAQNASALIRSTQLLFFKSRYLIVSSYKEKRVQATNPGSLRLWQIRKNPLLNPLAANLTGK